MNDMTLEQIDEVVADFYPELLHEDITKAEKDKLSEIRELIEIAASNAVYYYRIKQAKKGIAVPAMSDL